MSFTAKERARIWREKRYAEIEAMPKKSCACGCGELMSPINIQGKPIDYLKGHKQRGTKRNKPAHNRIGDKPLTAAERQARHREKKYAEIATMPKIPCACGCGTMIAPITTEFKPAQYAKGHNSHGEETRFKKGQKAWNEGLPAPWAVAAHTGKKHSPEAIAKRTATRRAKHGGVYQTAHGWKHTPETIARMVIVGRANALYGANNPMFGKIHSPEVRVKISLATSGAKHSHWKGGRSFFPYGYEFNRKFKRLIRERDNYTCQRCGITQSELGYTIHIHHLDHDKMNSSPHNLVCACARCNIWASWNREIPFVNPDVWQRTHAS